MPREVDKRKTSRALRKLERVTRAAEVAGAELTRWEQDFVSGVADRLETYGSAFRDPQKGALDEALSQRQAQIVRVLAKKTRPRREPSRVSAGSDTAGDPGPDKPRPRTGLQSKKPLTARKPMRTAKPLRARRQASGRARDDE
jgi:hypothetical protein